MAVTQTRAKSYFWSPENWPSTTQDVMCPLVFIDTQLWRPLYMYYFYAAAECVYSKMPSMHSRGKWHFSLLYRKISNRSDFSVFSLKAFFQRRTVSVFLFCKRLTEIVKRRREKSEDSAVERHVQIPVAAFLNATSGGTKLSGKLSWHLTGSDSNKAADRANTDCTQRMLLWLDRRKLNRMCSR